ncbi:MAG: hypothetical protein GX638_03810, partial [Crenarchaeota archaeon]|nr:hypothetical protein [Thermoproteota archaeon]
IYYLHSYYNEPDLTDDVKIKIRKILVEVEKKAIEIVKENKELLEHLYPILIKEGVITGEEMVKYLEKIEQNS